MKLTLTEKALYDALKNAEGVVPAEALIELLPKSEKSETLSTHLCGLRKLIAEKIYSVDGIGYCIDPRHKGDLLKGVNGPLAIKFLSEGPKTLTEITEHIWFNSCDNQHASVLIRNLKTRGAEISRFRCSDNKFRYKLLGFRPIDDEGCHSLVKFARFNHFDRYQPILQLLVHKRAIAKSEIAKCGQSSETLAEETIIHYMCDLRRQFADIGINLRNVGGGYTIYDDVEFPPGVGPTQWRIIEAINQSVVPINRSQIAMKVYGDVSKRFLVSGQLKVLRDKKWRFESVSGKGVRSGKFFTRAIAS